MMPIVEITRLEEDFDSGTFGVLRLNKQILCMTLERPDLENEKNLSSIPAQQYICEYFESPKFGKTYKVVDVPGRSNIIFHLGNILNDTAGCILLGQYITRWVGSVKGLANSRIAFEDFMARLDGHDSLHLTITEVY